MVASTRTPFFYNQVPKNLFLVVLSFVTIPISTFLVVIGFLISRLNPGSQSEYKQQHGRTQKTILVTGVSMTKGLTIARLLAKNTHHRIIGADIEPVPLTSPGRYSNSIQKFYRLVLPAGDDAEPYIDSLLSVIRAEKVDLWISCSSVVSAVEDGDVANLARKELGKKFEAVQFSPEVVEKLHEKDNFIEYIQSIGLAVPESYRCTDADQVLAIMDLSRSKGRKFIMKPIGVDDRARASMMTLLPLATIQETKQHMKTLRVSKENPYQLQQYMSGPEYCTHALVIRGNVKAFVACPSSDLLMHYTALPSDSQLSQQMLKFTERVAADGGSDFTGHLSFDFLASSTDPGAKLFAIECNPRAHTAVILFQNTPAMADAYLDIFASPSEHRKKREGYVVPTQPTQSYYWIGHDLADLVIIPFFSMLVGHAKLVDLKVLGERFWNHLVYWRDGTFVVDDPVPFWVLYHVYWPARFAECIWRGKVWSRINVSTTKIFEC